MRDEDEGHRQLQLYVPVRIDNIHTCGELDVAWFDRKNREWHCRAGIKLEECRTLGSKPYLLLDAKLKIARDAGIIHRRDPAPCGGGVSAVGLYYREWKRAMTARRAASTLLMPTPSTSTTLAAA